MNIHTNYQTIQKNGKPEYVVVPYKDFIQVAHLLPKKTYPQEVIELIVLKEYSHIRAWREYRKLSQLEMANHLGISQPAYSKIEASKRPRKVTKEKVANILRISLELLS